MATGLWRRITDQPLPKLGAGDPREQVEQFELMLIARAREVATPESAREIAEATWDLVHDRPDSDAVKSAVTSLHEELARLTHGGSPG